MSVEPSTSAKILLVMPAGSQVTPNGELACDLEKVTHNGGSV